MMKKLTVVIPVFNSENTIAKIVNSLIDELNDYELEIILVNDGSSDNSENVCIALFEQFPFIVKFYSLSKNFGEHNAVMAALNNATGDFVLIMDDDFQNPISEVSKLANFAFSNSFDVVYTYYVTKKHSFFRNIASRFNNIVATYLLKKPKNLYLSSFKAISSFVVNQIIEYDLPFPYIDGLILRTTSNIGQLKVKHEKRAVGKSQYNLVKLIALWLNMVTNFSIKPLRLVTFLGFFFSIVGFLLAVAGVLMKFFEPKIPLGYASLLISISILGGIQLIGLGMLGEYVGRIFLSISKMPQFVIRKKYEK
jgi:undecaprenyl-phosphate 4-deoxy-4-formamido-L-arabinose transferase